VGTAEKSLQGGSVDGTLVGEGAQRCEQSACTPRNAENLVSGILDDIP
jgi:hypothetical protein